MVAIRMFGTIFVCKQVSYKVNHALKHTQMIDKLDIAFTNKEITPFGGLVLLYKMLERCHFVTISALAGGGFLGDSKEKRLQPFN